MLNTEFVTKKGRYLYLDFLGLLEDDTLLNIEFQFKATEPIDLSRFFDYNIISQTTYDLLCETTVVSFRTRNVGHTKRKIGKTKSTHPEFVYIGEIEFAKILNRISNKVNANSKLTNNDELLLMLMCLVPATKNKAEILAKICKMLKKERLFDTGKIDTFKSVIQLEIDNLITDEERKKLKGSIKMSPETLEKIVNAIDEVGRKYEYLEKQEILEEGIEKGRKEGIEEGIEKGRNEEKKNFAKKLKGKIPDEEISQLCELDLKTVTNL